MKKTSYLSSPMKDEKLAAGVVDEECGDGGGNVGIGGVEAEAFDKQGTGVSSDKECGQRKSVEKHEFVMPLVFAGLEDKQDIEDVRREVGEEKADGFIDPVVPQAERFRNRTDVEMEKAKQFCKRITFPQRRKNQPGKKEKNGHILIAFRRGFRSGPL